MWKRQKETYKGSGDHPRELEPYTGQIVTALSDGFEPTQGMLIKGLTNYFLVQKNIKVLDLYSGSSIIVKTQDGKEIDLSKVQL